MADVPVRLKRFSAIDRLWHLGLVISFMIMGVTGLAWMFIETAAGKWLSELLGGYRMALDIHRIAGLIFLAGFISHALYMIVRFDWARFAKAVRDPDNLVFQWSDAKDFGRHLLWIVGLAKAPRFERYSWWEKFDYWAVWWGLFIVGFTGLILYDPVWSSDFMPGWLLNVALWVHRIEAMLAMGHIFTVHYFIGHFRPHTFPYSDTMFSGTVPLEQAREEHPAWVERLEREGRLQAELVPEPPVPLRILYFGVGYALIGLGLFLLVFALANITAVTLF